MTSVIVASEVRLYREGLLELLHRDGRLRVVGLATSALGTVTEATKVAPHAVLMDMALTDVVPALRRIRQHLPEAKTIALNLTEAEDEVLKWAEAGIDGFVSRDASIEELVQAVVSAVREELQCTPRIAAALLHRVGALASIPPEGGRDPSVPLTPRERQVALLLDEGLSNKAIARRLSIQAATVKNHVHNILEKLHARTRLEAAARLRDLPP
jgi:DNA-binding NarL/FixJ family response regulator